MTPDVAYAHAHAHDMLCVCMRMHMHVLCMCMWMLSCACAVHVHVWCACACASERLPSLVGRKGVQVAVDIAVRTGACRCRPPRLPLASGGSACGACLRNAATRTPSPNGLTGGSAAGWDGRNSRSRAFLSPALAPPPHCGLPCVCGDLNDAVLVPMYLFTPLSASCWGAGSAGWGLRLGAAPRSDPWVGAADEKRIDNCWNFARA